MPFPNAAGWSTSTATRVRVYQTGDGGPSVVIAPGAGDCASSWAPVVGRIAAFARVLSYDRAGLGGSQNGPAPTVERYLAELGEVLARAAGPGPYLLVGHSLGGLILRLYAQRHPQDVAGLVSRVRDWL